MHLNTEECVLRDRIATWDEISLPVLAGHGILILNLAFLSNHTNASPIPTYSYTLHGIPYYSQRMLNTDRP